MDVLLANPRSFCSGVDRAIAVVEQALQRYGAPVYVYHEIVHNDVVLDSLAAKGAQFITSLGDAPDDAVLVFNAHGVSQAVKREAQDKGMQVLDATCPLVSKIHHEVMRHRKAGRDVLLVGEAGHAEIIGTLGQATRGVHLIETLEDVARVNVPDAQQVAWATQTTLTVDEAAGFIAAIRARFPAAVGPKTDDVCYASQNRQTAVRMMAPRCDVVIVVGSMQSHNTGRLADTARELGARVHRVDRADQVEAAWVLGARRVGVTAAPPQLVHDVVAALQAAGARKVVELEGPEEKVNFPMPRGMQPARSSFSDVATRLLVPQMPKYPLLAAVDKPEQLRRLPRSMLPQLAAELRDCVLDSVSATGGHFASNLGTVELAVALHYVFDTPRDRLVWDVGHQAYPHKILTGRRGAMPGLRQLGGISGFPKRDESEYDAFGTAHSSTSISAALGMAAAARLKGEDRKAVAVIGDGALTGGMAFEAMNNAALAGTDMLVILNDNEMSISPPVGALNGHLARLTKNGGAAAAPGAGNLFEAFGFHYTGPVDGHDLDALVPALQEARDAKGPRFLHIVTRKGKGYARAEADPVGYHATGKFDPVAGVTKRAAGKPTFTQVFGNWLCDMAAHDERLVGITPAMREGSGMVDFERRFPARYFDVGICEQHAVTFAAGLACDGMKPVVAVYSTFLQRGLDQAIHDVAIQDLPVVFALDRAGVVGADGATHCGAFDIAYLRCLPNFSVLAPSDENECRQLLSAAFAHDHPVAIRYPRGEGIGAVIQPGLAALPWGKGQIRRSGKRVAILAFGTLLHAACAAADKLDATVADMRFVKPLDVELVLELARTHEALVTIEEGCIQGGAGSAVLEALHAAGMAAPVLQLGLPDQFVEHGDTAVVLGRLGLDAPGIERAVLARFGGVALSAPA